MCRVELDIGPGRVERGVELSSTLDLVEWKEVSS